MALIIEDGTGKTDSNSYASVDDLKAYASARGISIPQADNQLEPLLINAADYVESHRSQFSGNKATTTQAMQYPRIGSTVDGVIFPSDAIPKELINAQCQLAVDKLEIGDLTPTTTDYAVAAEKVDTIEIQYAAGGRLSGTTAPMAPSFPKADAWLQPLFAGFGGGLRTLRI